MFNNTYKIFISYAREDIDFAKKIYSDLGKYSSLNPWLDVEDLLPGQNWKLTVMQTIKECSFFLLLLSNHSIRKRGFVQKEIKYAIEVLEELPESQIFIMNQIF